MWTYLAYGSYQKYYESVNDIYKFINDDVNENVFITELPDEVIHFPEMEILQDMSDWRNAFIAKVYGQKPVQYILDSVCKQDDG